MSDYLDIIDRLDVPTLLVVCVYGFWYLHKQLTVMQRTQAVQNIALQTLITQVKDHAAADVEEHRRIYDKIDAAREVIHGA